MKNKKLLAILIAAFSTVAVSATALTGCDSEDTPSTHTEHTYGEWTVTTTPTQTSTGTASRSCSEGDDTQTITLPALSDSGYVITGDTATATAAGTGTYTITVDGVTISFTAATPATGSSDTHTHSYGTPSWAWADDYSSATATFTCTSNDDTQSVTATVSSTTEGTTATYTATVTFNGQTYTDTKTATVEIAVSGVTLDKTSQYATIGESYTLTATVSPSDAAAEVEWSSSDTSLATVDSNGNVNAIAAGTVTITATAGGKSATCEITVREVNTREIATVSDLIAFRALDNLSGEYKLIADIDLAGVTLDSPTAVTADGVTFDGQGYTISNAAYTAGSSKEGILFKTIKGGTVTNIKFLNCSITSTSESAAILAGECNASSTISKIEFNSCSAATSNNYVGLIFARREGSDAITINISEITAKNGCTTSCAQYGGFLVGDFTSGTTVNFKDLDIDGEFKDSSGNGSFIAGRTRGGNVSVENAVISATMPEVSSVGIFSGNGSLTTLTIKNVLIVKSNVAALYQSTKAPAAKNIENLVTVEGVTVNESTAQNGEDTAAYLKDTLGFDFSESGAWVAEGTSGYRLSSASANEKSADATIESLKLSTDNAQTRLKKDGAFSTDGLSVVGVYSDGVQIVLDENDGYVIDHSAVDVSKAGTYTVTVTSKEDSSVTATYSVTVVEETGFVIYDEFMTKTYVVGGTLDSANLVIKSLWSDGAEEQLSTSEYSVDATSYSMTSAGAYNVKVTYGTYDAQTIAITVISAKAELSDNTVTINVSQDQTVNGALVDGVYTFTTVKDAIDYLEACNYDDSVIKVVNIGAGTYEAKITTSLCNLTLIGANTTTEDDKSVLTYSAVESTVNIVTGSTYGLDCATLQVNGTGLTIKNLTIRNDFDYINESANESSPQGLALTVNGDKAVIENCHLYGNQDTLYLKNGRAYFYNTLIEGNVDFIFGNATGLAYFDTCEIRAISRFAVGSEGKNNGYVTAMKATSSDKPDYGYIFYNCAFTDDGRVLDGSMSLGRPWGASATVAMINCSFSKAYSTLAYDGSAKSRWYDMSGNSPVNADFCEYGSTGEGAITEAVTGGKVLTAAEAANYTKENLFAATNGKCSWSSAWSGSNEAYTVTIYNGDAYLTAISVNVGVTLTADTVISAANEKLGSQVEAVGVYTDSSCTTALVSGELTGSITVYITTAAADLTITESLTYSVSNGDFTEVSSGTSYIGKLQVEGQLKANGDWYIVGGTISAKLQKGSTISITVYSTDSVKATVGGAAVELALGSDTSKGYVYSYTATADCTVVLTANNATLYVKSIDVKVPTVYSTSTKIDLSTTSSSDISLQNSTGEYLGM